MRTSEIFGARTLHFGEAMKWIVGILAATALGCGVGVDDPEGFAAISGDAFYGATLVQSSRPAGTSTYVAGEQADVRERSTFSEVGFSGVTSQTTEGGTGTAGGTRYAPQDPIPAKGHDIQMLSPALWPSTDAGPQP